MRASSSLYVYVGAVGAATAGLTAAFLRTNSALTLLPEQILLVVSGIGLILAAGYCPICIGRNVQVNMASTVIFAMILLLPPAHVTIATAAGIGILYTLMRWPLVYVAFNVAQSSLVVGATSLALTALGAPPIFERFGVFEVAVAAAGAGVFFLINSAVVTTFAVLHGSSGFLAHWKSSFGRSAVPYLSTLLLGIVVAVTYVHAPVVTPMLVLPTIVIYRSLRDARSLRKQTRDTVEFLADIMDRRDPYTYEHSQRVSDLARKIAARLGLPPDEQAAVAQAARVHDLGKLGIDNRLLNKAERLAPHELEEIRRHSVIGAEIVGKLADYTEGKDYILFHHERYDGSGAFRLYGEHIPLGARIIAVADAFDAMMSDRPYRRALTREEALAEMAKASGSQFDPVATQALLTVLQEEDASAATAHRSAVAASPTQAAIS